MWDAHSCFYSLSLLHSIPESGYIIGYSTAGEHWGGFEVTALMNNAVKNTFDILGGHCL
jgi:hypothetical protein